MIQDRLAEQQRQSAAMLNYLSDYADEVVGLPVLSPRLQMPQPKAQVFHHGNMNTFNNINVDRSTVGSINTGSINSIDVTLGQLGQGGAGEITASIKEFTEALLQEAQVANETRTAMLEQLAFVSEQLLTPEDQQKKSVIRQTWNSLTAEAGRFTSLAAALEKIKTTIGPVLGLSE